MDLTSTFAPITKTAEQDDGSLLVYGKATDDSLDLDDQRCDAEWLKTAMPEWFSYGNIREQHRADSAIGKAIEHEASTDGHYITARIVDPVAVLKTKAGIFTGFSIGIRKPKIVKSELARNGLIKGGTITEVSLVDRPANSNAILTLCKTAKTGWEGSGADLDIDRGLVRCEELLVDEEAIAKELQVTVTKGVEDPEPEPKPKVSVTLDGQPLDPKTFGTTITIPKALDLDAPAAGQKCADCGEDGHLMCFDRDKAIELVDATLDKAADGLGQDESGDVSGANQAIATIAQLIISEAKDLAKMPAQGCDIHLLMSAVDALRCFSRREQEEQAGVDPDASAMALAADVDVAKGKYSAEQLRSMLAAGKAMKNPNGEPSYPIGDKEDLSNAIRAVGRGSGDHGAIRAYIKRRASALGASSMIPDNWSSSGKAADSDGSETVTSIDLNPTTTTTNAGNVTVTKAAPPEVEEAPVEEPVTEESEVDKALDSDDESADEPDTTKAATTDSATDPDVLVKAFTSALDKEDSPLRKMFVDIVEASTETTAKSLSDLGERLVKVEAMATPGGPALRRTEAERINARKSDLLEQSARYKALSAASEDPDLRKGYGAKAAQIDAEIKAL